MRSVNVDVELQDLALQAKYYQPDTIARRIALSELCCELQRDDRLKVVCGCFNLLPEAIDRCDRQARSEALLAICHRIDEYNIDRGSIVAWAKGILLEEWQRALQQQCW